jgi:hypothetical protein
LRLWLFYRQYGLLDIGFCSNILRSLASGVNAASGSTVVA